MTERRRTKSQRRHKPVATGQPSVTIPDVVPHPRYGDTIVPSGCTVSAEVVRSSYWRYHQDTIFPESAIPANTARQNFSVFPRGFYVDTLRQCRTCGRSFIFFAREQQHWYEVLGFYVDADCIHCPECRKSDQQLRRRFQRYSANIGRTDNNDQELETLIDDAVFLWQAGVLRDEQKLRRLRNLARERLPDNPVMKNMERVLAESIRAD